MSIKNKNIMFCMDTTILSSTTETLADDMSAIANVSLVTDNTAKIQEKKSKHIKNISI